MTVLTHYRRQIESSVATRGSRVATPASRARPRKNRTGGALVILCVLFVWTVGGNRATAATALADNGMVATVHPLATDAAVQAFGRGGNAVDAAIAAALTLGVVDNHNSGLGGGCFILIRRGDGRLAAIDGRETAPGAATRDMYVRDGNAETGWSQTGPLAVAVPGALAAYATALDAHGKLKLRGLLLPAAEIAENGFPIDRVYAGKLVESAEYLRRFAGATTVLLKPDGSPRAEGDILKQPDLARTYRMIAKMGPSWFYHGPMAKRISRWMQDNGGILRSQDFANYRAKSRQPVVTTYRDYTIVGFPPPSSGGVHVAQILNILENFSLGHIQNDPKRRVHLIAESMKFAFADRAYFLGDSDFAQVPLGLIDKGYARRLAARIDAEQVAKVERQGEPPNDVAEVFGHHTTHIAAADRHGNWAAITATVNTSFGSKVIVPGTGLVLNNQMDDFSVQPGVPNAFGLIGAMNNSVEPGKRPLSSMSPTIVLKDGEPILTLGAAGGPKIITQVVLALINYLDLGMPLDRAVAEPRFHHQWVPDQVWVEERFPQDVVDSLINRGHTVSRLTSAGVMQAIARTHDGRFLGVHDPRVPGKAAGY